MKVGGSTQKLQFRRTGLRLAGKLSGQGARTRALGAGNKSTKQRHPGTRLHSNKLISLVYSDSVDLFSCFFGLLTVNRAAASLLALQHKTAGPPVLLRIEASTVSPGKLV